MAFTSLKLENFPLPYQNAVRHLIQSVEATSSIEEVEQLFEKFAEKFTLIPELSEQHHLYLFQRYGGNTAHKNKILYTAFSHLIDERWKLFDEGQFTGIGTKYLNKLTENYFMSRNFEFNCVKSRISYTQKHKALLDLPISATVPNLWEYRMQATSMIPPKLNETNTKAFTLSKNLRLAEENEDDEKWFELLEECNDIKCIVQNFECRIGKKPWAKEIWNLYLKYLEKQKLNELLLHTYSRYCHLFVEDIKAFEQYKSAVEKISSIDTTRWQHDITKLKKDYGITDKHQRPLNYHVSNNSLLNSPLIAYLIEDFQTSSVLLSTPSICYSSTGLLKTQNFSLPFSLIYHIVKEAAPAYHLQKLYFSSKLFYHIQQIPICYKLDISSVYDSQQIYENTLFISPDDLSISKNLPNFYFTKVLSLSKMQHSSVSKITQKLAAINITELYLFEQWLPLADFVLLASKVKIFGLNRFSAIVDGQLSLTASHIISKMPLIETAIFHTGMKLFPNLENDNEFSYPKKSVKTLKNFFVLLLSSTELINTTAICKFIKENAAFDSHFHFTVNKSSIINFYMLDNERAQSLLDAITKMFTPCKQSSSPYQKAHFKLTLNKRDYYFML